MRYIFFVFCFVGGLCSFEAGLVNAMTLEEKVGQVLMVHFNGRRVNEDAKTLVQGTKVGAIIYYNWSNGLTSAEQVKELSEGLQNLARATPRAIPLLIATDQEGGVVARLRSGFTSFPGNRALGETGDPNLAEEAAFVMGKELLSVGINMNLAPVVDVDSNPKNPVIGARSFGNRPEIVALFGKRALDGFRRAGVIATLKHFPGYGDVAVDPHKDLPVIDKSQEDLEKVELFPFAKLASVADAIMTAHILVPALDAKYCATLSEKTLRYLREQIGFQGVIVADSLVMEGVLKQCSSVDEASILALNAGCDLLIVKAVQSGRLAEEKLNQSVERVLRLKNLPHAAPEEPYDEHRVADEIVEEGWVID
jgi:beta-N-acetylhexosaminidase